MSVRRPHPSSAVDAALARELPVVLDLLGVAVGAGLHARTSRSRSRRSGRPRRSPTALARVVRSCALGLDFAAALDAGRDDDTAPPAAGRRPARVRSSRRAGRAGARAAGRRGTDRTAPERRSPRPEDPGSSAVPAGVPGAARLRAAHRRARPRGRAWAASERASRRTSPDASPDPVLRGGCAMFGRVIARVHVRVLQKWSRGSRVSRPPSTPW